MTTLAAQARGHALDEKTKAYTRGVTWVWAASAGMLAVLIIPGLLLEAWRSVATAIAFGQGPFYIALWSPSIFTGAVISTI